MSTNDEKAALYEQIQRMGAGMPAFERREREQHRQTLRRLVATLGDGNAVNIMPDSYTALALRCALRVLGESLDGPVSAARDALAAAIDGATS